ncbi:MAG: hypothetical protein AB1Z21_11230, partial [Synechococcaceae cyanobacterium]
LIPLDQFRSVSIVDPLRWLQGLLANDFHTERIYRSTVVAFVAGAARLTDWVDQRLVNGLVNGIGRLSLQSAENLRLSVSGQLQSYVLTVVVAIVILLTGISWWGGLPDLLPDGVGHGLRAGLGEAEVEVLR